MPQPISEAMENYEKMQPFGIHDVYAHSLKIIFSWRKLLAKITVALIIPLCLLSILSHQLLSVVQSFVSPDRLMMISTPEETENKWITLVAGMTTKEWTVLTIVLVVIVIVSIIAKMLSTAAVVYSTACFYSGTEVNFRKVMKVVPKVLMKLLFTLLIFSLIVFTSTFVCVFALISSLLLKFNLVVLVLVIVLMMVFMVGLWYLIIVYQLALVVSVLEEVSGLKAMLKGRYLMKGKLLLVIGIVIIQVILYVIVEGAKGFLGIIGEANVVLRMCGVIVGFLLVSLLFLLENVVFTVYYFVCKTYHGELIDKNILSDHLEVYGWEYVPLKSSDVQLENYNV